MTNNHKQFTGIKSRISSRTIFLLVFTFFILIPQALFAGASVELVSASAGHTSIAPASVPVASDGTATGIGMTKLIVYTNSNLGDQTATISAIDIALTSDNGAFDESWITDIRVYMENDEVSGLPGNAVYDNGSGYDDFELVTTGAVTFDAGWTKTITFDAASSGLDGSPSTLLYVVFDFDFGVDIATALTMNVGCEVTGLTATEDFDTNTALANHDGRAELDSYEASITTTGNAPTNATQGEADIQVFQLDLDIIEAGVTGNLDSLKLRRTGTVSVDADLATGGVLIYDDSGVGNVGSFGPGDQQLGSATLTGGYATVYPRDPSDPLAKIPITDSTTFWITSNLAVGAVVDHNIGLDIENPSTDIVWADVIYDIYFPNQVAGTEYNHTAYISSTTAEPTTGHIYNVDEIVVVDTTPPTVLSSLPADTNINERVDRYIDVTFNEDMDPGTIIGANFSLTYNAGGTTVTGTVSYQGLAQTLRFIPSSVLPSFTEFTATVTTGVTDVAGNALETDFVFTFYTENPPNIASTFPGANSTFNNVNATITAIFGEAMEVTTITSAQFTLDELDGQAGAVVTADVPGLFSYLDDPDNEINYTPTAVMNPNTWYRVTLDNTIADLTQNTIGGNTATDYVWEFKSEPSPSVVNTIPPNTGQFVEVNGDVLITFNEDMNLPVNLPDDDTVVSFFEDATPANTVAGTITYASGTQTITFNPTALLTSNMTYRVTVRDNITSLSGNPLAADYVFTFTTEGAPAIASTSPSNSAQYIPINTDVTATFAEDMDATSITTSEFALESLDGQAGAVTGTIAGAFSYSDVNDKLTFDPTALLNANTWYRATIDSTVAGQSGNQLLVDYVYEFQTEPAPRVTNTIPSNTAQFVSVDVSPIIAFSENMNLPATITDNESVVTFYDDAGTPNRINGAITYDSGTQKITFDPTALLNASTTYTVTVLSTVADLTANALGSDQAFSFTTEPPPSVAATSPSDQAQFIQINSDVTVTFAENMDETTVIAGNFTMQSLDGQGGASTGTIAGAFAYDDGTNIITYNPTALLSANIWHRITLSTVIADQSGNQLGTDYVFEFQTEPSPMVTSTTPSNGTQFIPVNTTFSAVFSENMNLTAAVTDDESVITFYDDAGTPNRINGSIAYDNGNQKITFTPAAILSASTTYTVTILAAVADLTGNTIGSDSVYTFTTEPVPTIAATTPSDISQFITVDTDVTATFAENMDETTVIAANFAMESLDGQGGASTGTITGNFSYNDVTNVITFDPTALLTAATWFRVTLDSLIADQTGNPLGTDYVFEFATEPSPTVLTTIPANSAQFITVNVPVTVTFSENMNLPATITDNESVVTFYDDAGTPNRVTAGITYDSGTQKITIAPIALLVANTTYTVTILSGVVDLTGNPMLSDYVFTFSIEPNTNIAATTPADSSQFISIDSDVTVTFAENMDETTVIAGNYSLEELDGPGGAVQSTVAGAFGYNDGTNLLTFNPTALLSSGTWYRATVTDSMTDQSGNPLSADYAFEFKTEPNPIVTTSTPANGAQFIGVDTTFTAVFSENMNLTATITDDESVITFYDDAGTPNRINGVITYNSGTHNLVFTPAVVLVANTTYTITMLSTVADLSGNTLGSDYIFTFETEPNPSVAATVPANNAQFIQVNSDIEVTFAENMDETTVTAGTFSLESLNGQGGAVTGSETGVFNYDDGTNLLTFNPDTILSASIWYRVTLDSTISDTSGNILGTDYTLEFKTEQPPGILSTIPADTAQFIGVNTTITVSFAEEMNLPATVTDNELVITVYDSTPSRVTAADISYAAQNMVFTPTSILSAEETYTVTVLSAVTDLTGNPMGIDYEFEFTTEPATTIAATNPSNTGQFIVVDTNVTVTFPENMDETTTIAANFALEELDGQGGAVIGTVAGAFGYNDGSNVLTFNPTALLDAETWYRATVDAAVADQTGNTIGSDYVFEFKSEPAPIVLNTIPSNNSLFVALNADVTATFSARMNLSGTITDDESIITFYDDAGTPNRITATSITYDAGNQQLNFVPSALLEAGTTYTVTIFSGITNENGNPMVSDSVFSFTAEPPPTISTTVPSNNALFVDVDTNIIVSFSELVNLSATVTDDESVITVYDDAGTPNRVMATGITYNVGTYQLTFDPTGVLDPNTVYTVTVISTVADYSGNELGADYVFSFTTEPPPGVAATIPASGARFIAVDTFVTVTFAEDMDATTVTDANFILESLVAQGGAVDVEVPGIFGYVDATNKISFDPISLLAADTWHRVTIDAAVTDQTGNPIGADYIYEFQTEPAPSVLTSIPANNASFVSVDNDVTITFSEDMDLPATILDNLGTVTFYDDAGTPNRINGTISYDSGTQKITFNPAALLIADTTYTITVLADVADLTGNELGSAYIFSFTTEPNPSVVITSPPNTATFVNVNEAVTVTFSENMDEATAIAANFAMESLDGQAGAVVSTIAGGFAYNDGSNIITFTPSANLGSLTWYRITVTDSVTDQSGNPLSSDFTFEFRTEAPPAIAATTPSNNAEYILVGNNVTITFAEDMDQSTIIAGNITLESLAAKGGVPDGTVTSVLSYDAPSKTITYNPNVNLDANKWYRLSLSAAVADLTGHQLGTDYIFEFKTEPNPVVAAVIPADTSQFNLVNSDVQVTFAENMDETTVIAGNFVMNSLLAQGGATSGTIAGAFSYDDGTNIITFDPAALLTANSWYRVTIDAAVADQSGNPLGTDYVIEFKTEPAPTVVTTNPGNTAQFILVNTDVTVTFSEDMNLPATVPDDESVITFYDTATGLTRINAGSITYSSGNQKLTFTLPAAVLEAITEYTVTILAAVTDSTGNPLSSDYSFSFTTEPNTVVAATSPTNLSQFVLVDTDVTVTFAEDMKESTVVIAGFDMYELDGQGGAQVAAVTGDFVYNDVTNIITFSKTPPLSVLKAFTWYRVIVSSTMEDESGNPLGTDYIFEFKTEPNPAIAAVVPAANSQFVAVNSDVTVTFAENMDETTVIAANFSLEELDGQGGAVTGTIAGVFGYDDVGNVLTFNPAAVLDAVTWYKATVSSIVADQSGNPIGSDYEFEFRTESNPVVLNTDYDYEPKGVLISTNIKILFSEDMNLPVNLDVDDDLVITLYQDLAVDVRVQADSITYNSGTQKLTFDPAVNLVPSSNYIVTVFSTVTDLTLNPLGTDYVHPFTTEGSPVVSSTSPIINETDVLVDESITITFGEDMDAATIVIVPPTPQNITLVGPSGVVAGAIGYDSPSQTITFDPSANLEAASVYTLTVSDLVTDINGNPLAVSYELIFTTEGGPIVSSPIANVTLNKFQRHSTIAATFNRSMDPATLIPANFIIQDDDGIPVIGSIAYNDETKTAVFTPDELLEYQTTYTVTITTDVTDIRGNPLSAPHIWTLLTLGSTDFTEPTAINSHISSDNDEPVRIFIQTPPAGENDRISVTVFTNTGRKIMSLVTDRPYSEIVAELPLVWDGINGSGEKLGPGLYFIQIKGTGFKKVLKILITR